MLPPDGPATARLSDSAIDTCTLSEGAEMLPTFGRGCRCCTRGRRPKRGALTKSGPSGRWPDFDTPRAITGNPATTGKRTRINAPPLRVYEKPRGNFPRACLATISSHYAARDAACRAAKARIAARPAARLATRFGAQPTVRWLTECPRRPPVAARFGTPPPTHAEPQAGRLPQPAVP